MTETVKLGGKLPAGDRNGLVRIVSQFIDDPKAAHVVVAIVDCKQLTRNTDDDSEVPLVRLQAIEPLLGAEAIAVASGLLRAAHEERTGKVALPFDLTQDDTRVTIDERPDLPDAGDVAGDQGSSPTTDDDAEQPPWEEGYPEGPAGDDGVDEKPGGTVTAFRSPFAAGGQ